MSSKNSRNKSTPTGGVNPFHGNLADAPAIKTASIEAAQKLSQCDSPEELAVALKKLSAADLLAFRQRNFEQYERDRHTPPEQVEVVKTEIGGRAIIQPLLIADLMVGGRQILAVADTEIHARQLWPWTDEVHSIVPNDADLQKVFGGGMYCSNAKCECHQFEHEPAQSEKR